MNRSLIALALSAAGLASFSVQAAEGLTAHGVSTSDAAVLEKLDCTRGPRSEMQKGGGSLVPADPVSYLCYRTYGYSDGAWTAQGPKLSEADYNIRIAKLAGLRADPRIREATRQANVLANLNLADEGRARTEATEAKNGIRSQRVELQQDGTFKSVAVGRTHATELDMFAIKGMQRNVDKAKKAVELALADPANASSVATQREGLTSECDSDIFRAKLDLQQLDDTLRKSTIQAFEKRCAAKDKQRAEADRKAAALAAEKAASVETPWQLEPALPLFNAEAGAVGSAIQAMLDSGELASFSIIVNPDKPTYTLVLDNSPKSKLLYLLLEPRVRQKELNLRVIPTSLYSEDAKLAAEMLDRGGFNYMYRWMSLPADWKASYKASDESLAKVAQNNEKLLAAQLNGVPFRIHSSASGKTAPPAFGLFTEKDFAFKDWPHRSWTENQLYRLNKETTLLTGHARSAQACPIQKEDMTEGGGTVDGKETWKMTSQISFMSGCDYSKGGLPAGYSSGAQR